ncbi:hypothetical protein BCU83_18560 [Vibrio breoganii]|uniref:GIY-YIG domain-containing protein n=1 Tax=Vibrio breoganii TaxID=553239 RepID=A0AAN0XXK0_9VIBR|nr:hypothetical protein [Vibrio breoganii]ANO34647.1 hypothetical protein A6E01_15745 [Vibrio breoganii]PMF83541.1 hypothetical protein BCV08_14735 [Vibrio breoganii]PMG84054.1 hypothetical protein BCU83_18560 [Vibrio breoganii]PML36001.1 hypothetical protein BCT78_10905 [Vibrio breoganii]PML42035.1 hypothetical protein BCT77_18485 [Vibrio breoganii]
MDYEHLQALFEKEFEEIAERFKCFNLSIEQARASNEECIWHPGVYIWVHKKDGVLRVGRSLSNSRKRALEHINADTGGQMRAYGKDETTSLYLFNVRDRDQYHWVAALEIYFENMLRPKIKAGRLG